MRCLALVAINLMCILNESDGSNVCVVDCDVFDVFLGCVWRLPGKNICAVLKAFSPIL